MGEELSKLNAIITGGARGIGLAIARRFHQEGARVCVWDQDPTPVDENKEASIALALSVDVTDEVSVTAAYDTTIQRFGQVDILVNNAGVNGPTVPFWEYAVADWDRVQDVDLKGVFLCSRAVAPAMRVRGNGRIIHVSSVVGKTGGPNAIAYCAAKAGVIGLTKSMAMELVKDGVLVNAIAPAMAETDLLNEMSPNCIAEVKARMPMGRLCTVEEIADVAAWVASPRCSFTTGQVFDVSGGRAQY